MNSELNQFEKGFSDFFDSTYSKSFWKGRVALYAILEIANRHNVTVIEDCCLCLGSTYKNRLAGTFGKASYFSFQWNKPFTPLKKDRQKYLTKFYYSILRALP